MASGEINFAAHGRIGGRGGFRRLGCQRRPALSQQAHSFFHHLGQAVCRLHEAPD